jgi:heat shock protein HslJ
MHLRSTLAVMACLSLGACVVPVPVPAPAPSQPSPPASAPAPVPAPTPPNVAAAPDGQLAGNGSCNTLRGRYTLSGNTLKIGPIVTTRMACATPTMEQEDRVLTALERAATARVPPHGFLTLADADGAVLLRASRLGAKP